MGQQTSEMRDQYYDNTDQGQSDVGSVVSNVDTLLADHHQQGPTKVCILHACVAVYYVHGRDLPWAG